MRLQGQVPRGVGESSLDRGLRDFIGGAGEMDGDVFLNIDY
jgi:hypothetical protein